MFASMKEAVSAAKKQAPGGFKIKRVPGGFDFVFPGQPSGSVVNKDSALIQRIEELELINRDLFQANEDLKEVVAQMRLELFKI